ncbi:MAG: hypothetical protein AAFU73_22160 [Planctomycetota bacterium]
MLYPRRRPLSRSAAVVLGAALALGCRTKDQSDEAIAQPAVDRAQAVEASAQIPPDPETRSYSRAERSRNERFQDLRQRRIKGDAPGDGR